MQTPKKKQQEGGSFLESVPELQDEARMRYLFSNFPLQRESNPKKWDDLRTFWTTIIYPITYHPSKKVKYDVSRHNNVFSVSLHDLKEWLNLRGMVPFGLETLLNNLEGEKKVQHETDFTASSSGITGWMVKALTSSLYWVSTGEPKVKEGKYIIIEIIREHAEEVMKKIREADRSAPGSEHLMLMSHIQSLVKEWNLSNEDLGLILLYLEKIKRLVVIQLNDGTVGVKINAQSTQVTETDKGILSMQVVLDMLDDQVAKLTSNIDSCVLQASELLKSKNRSRALAQLKKKKMLQEVMDKRLESVHKLQQILLSIDSATTNNQVVEAFATGVKSLKEINSKYKPEEVGEIFDDLGEALADQAEIDSAISANFSNSEIDESELEDELAALVSEDEQAKKEEEEKERVKKEKEQEKEREKERKAEEKRKEEEMERQKEKEKKTKEVELNEEELERQLEDLEKEEEGKEEKKDNTVDELADLVGGVKIEESKEKNKSREEPMLA